MKRHTRAHIREQRSRWIRKRLGQLRRVCRGDEDARRNWGRPIGMLSKQDPWDCGNTQCGICRSMESTDREAKERAVADYELLESRVKDE